MDLEKLEKMAILVLAEFARPNVSGRIKTYESLEAEFKDLINVAFQTLPDHQDLFTVTYRNIDKEYFGLTIDEGRNIIKHILNIIEIEKSSEKKTKEGKIFESAEEKMKQAGISFREENYPSAFHNLNSCLELILKDKLGIPTTISTINTSTIIDVLVSQKIEPYLYLAQVKKYVLAINNNIKHKGYSPSKIECLNAIKAMEDLISKLRDKNIEVTEEVKKKIFEGL